MFDLIIFLSGYYSFEFEFRSLFVYQSSFVELIKKTTNCNYECFGIKNKTSYNQIIKSLKEKEYKKVLIFYTGYGYRDLEKPYPSICPTQNSFDMTLNDLVTTNKHNEEIKFSYIFDCLYKYHLIKKEKENKNEEIINLKEKVAKFLQLDFEYICIEKGFLNIINKMTSTLLNQNLINIILNFKYETTKEFLEILNKSVLVNSNIEFDNTKDIILAQKISSYEIIVDSNLYQILKKKLVELNVNENENHVYYISKNLSFEESF